MFTALEPSDTMVLVILDYLASKTICSNDLVVVSPDVGGVARARAFAKKLSDAPLVIVDKRRHGHNVAEVMNLIGDVRGKVAVMVDDMIDTAGTIAKGAAPLHQEGAREVYACSMHAVFRCGNEFCYTCGAEWINKKASCACPLWHEANILHNQDEDDDSGNEDNEADYDQPRLFY